jgi:hypothetical protein
MTSYRHLPWMDDVESRGASERQLIGRNWVSSDLHSVQLDAGYDSESSASSMAGSSEDLSRDVTSLDTHYQSRHLSRDTRTSFRLLTYNVLTDKCIRPGQYTYCPQQLRYMTSRHVTIMAEVAAMDPHVICFQVLIIPAHSHTTFTPQ